MKRPLKYSLSGALILLWSYSILLSFSGCGRRLDDAPLGPQSSLPSIEKPAVQRDWQEIESSGILRMITYYNSLTYFIHRGGQAGFDFELIKRFAMDSGLTLEVVIAQPGDDLISLLNSGQGDVVCSGLPLPLTDAPYVLATRPTGYSQKVVLVSESNHKGQKIDSLAGLSITVPWDCPDLPRLQKIREDSNIPFRLNQGPSGMEAEELMSLVAEKRLQAIVVDDLAAKAGTAWIDGLVLGPTLGEALPTAWMVRTNSTELKMELDGFLKKHLYINEMGRKRRSQTYGIIYDRYFENKKTIQVFREAEHRPDISGRISGYDELVRRHCEPLGLDWRMVSALIYQESRFYPHARSKADARGLMQVLPAFAGAQADSLYHPAPNLRAGLRLMANTYNSFAYLDSLDRWRFTLATYHAGIGHVTDARRMTMDFARDPNSWENGLLRTLPLLMQSRHYRSTRHGYYGGGKTVDYVEEIINRYRTYCRLVPLDPDAASADTVFVDPLAGWDENGGGITDLEYERPPLK